MIEEHVKIHDQFSIEMKVGFSTQQARDISDFAVDIWMFVPNSLDINRYNYSKNDFYKDVKSNIRLITPVYSLQDIIYPEALPLQLLKESIQQMAHNPTSANISNYEVHIKMFQSILKSSMRNEVTRTKECKTEEDIRIATSSFVRNVSQIADEYRKYRQFIQLPAIEKQVFEYYLFGDEFMSNLIEINAFKLWRELDNRATTMRFESEKNALIQLITHEIDHKKNNAYPTIDKSSASGNRDIIGRFGTLKKYMESHLFLRVKTREDGVLVKQFYYSLAAGISMIFATVITFSAQFRYGNFTLPLFIALVVGYMLKDRIKELFRYYFAHKLDRKYFDKKTDISFNGSPIGWYKEGQSFIDEYQTPAEVMQLRNRSAILEAENRINDEKIILYRLQMQLRGKYLHQSNIYPVGGVNNIIRFNLTRFIQKMDNPHVPLYVTDEENNYKIIEGEKIYYLNIILRYTYLDQLELKKYRILFNREGIKALEKF